MIILIGRKYPRSDTELVEDYHNTKVVNAIGAFRNLTMTSSICHIALFYVVIIYTTIVSNDFNDQMMQFIGT